MGKNNEKPMKKCIYCQKIKAEKEFTLEHVIPKFLGGSYAPDTLKTRDVCGTCNNNLGLFVDAAFEKEITVYNELKNTANAFFNPEKPTALPLKSIGIAELSPPNINDDEVCEWWLGPLGEQIYWIRPKDDRMYWYTGGNPITAKKVKTRAYFMFSERTIENPLITWTAFKEAFSGRKVKKIMCTKISGADPTTIGFSEPDDVDKLRINYFNERCGNSQTIKTKISTKLDYDMRFMAKLALGLSHVLFGNHKTKSEYDKELTKALWFKEGDKPPQIYGSGSLKNAENPFKELFGVNHGVTITILPMPKGVVINLNLNKRMNWLISCSELEVIKSEEIDKLGEGICIILYKEIEKGLKITLPELIAHNTKSMIHGELDSIENIISETITPSPSDDISYAFS